MGTRSMPDCKVKRTECETRRAAHRVEADRAEQQPEQRDRDRLPHRIRRQITDECQPQQRQREIFGRAEVEREFRQRRRDQAEAQQTEHPRDERAEHRHAECCTGAALLRQLIAVDRNHDGRGLAGNTQKD